MSNQQSQSPKPVPYVDIILGFLTDLLIDGALIGMGAVLYYQFFVHEIFPVTISPALIGPVGGLTNAAYLMSGIPFIVGILSLTRAIAKTARKLSTH